MASKTLANENRNVAVTLELWLTMCYARSACPHARDVHLAEAFSSSGPAMVSVCV